jgi:16S rRNA (guanine527-N7)-methyltransferase
MAFTRWRIAELLAPFIEGTPLSDHQLEAVGTYLDLLLKWNSKINLTAIRDPEEMITRHFGESLFAARNLFPRSANSQSAIDLGSGAGFPGLPLKIWNQALDLTLVESNQRKAIFLREVARALALSGVKVQAERAEKLSAAADLVIFRAVERFEQILLPAQRLMKPQGRLALLIGDSQAQSARDTLTDLRWTPPLRIPLSRNRSLLVGSAGSLANK